MVKIFALNLYSKLTSGMEFCAHGTAHSVHCLCYTVVRHWPCPCLLLPSACRERMLNNKFFISCLVTAVEVLKYLQIVLGQTDVKLG